MNIIIFLSLLSLGTRSQSYASLKRIVGGEEAESGFAPYQIGIQLLNSKHICGGSIINNEWILTAAHCIYGFRMEDLKIITGTVDRTKPDAEYSIAKAKVHCDFNYTTTINDIAVLHLTKPIVYNNVTQPVELATSITLKTGDPLILTGWGYLSFPGFAPKKLQKIHLKYLDLKSCLDAWILKDGLYTGLICSLTKAGEGACKGDSGGPLVDSNRVQVGIVSWGKPCATGLPDVYMNVAYYRDWITSAIEGTGITC